MATLFPQSRRIGPLCKTPGITWILARDNVTHQTCQRGVCCFTAAAERGGEQHHGEETDEEIEEEIKDEAEEEAATERGRSPRKLRQHSEGGWLVARVRTAKTVGCMEGSDQEGKQASGFRGRRGF